MYQVSTKKLSLSITALLFSSIINAGTDANHNSEQGETLTNRMTQRPIDNFNPNISKLPVVPSASSTGSKGEYKALTPLQREADAAGGAMPLHYNGPTSRNKSEYVETQADVDARNAARAAIEKDLKATPVKDAFKESFDGYAHSNSDGIKQLQSQEDTDPSYDIGQYRQQFRSVYDEEDWGLLERTTNKYQYDALVKSLNEKARLKSVAEKSPLGHILGRIFESPLIY